MGKDRIIKTYTQVKLHNIKYELSISYLNNNQLLQNIKISIPKFNHQQKINNFIITEKIDESFIPQILSNSISFHSKTPFVLFNTNYNILNYTITKVSKSKKNEICHTGIVDILQNHSYTLVDNHISPSINLEQNSKSNIGIVNIPQSILYPGTYTLKIHNNLDTTEYSYNVLWMDKPISLNNIKTASEMMYLIMSDDEFKKLKSMNTVEQEEKIIEFWKTKDLDKSTAFLESMHIYYQRVDYANENFKTIKVPTGATSPRGQIYILNGPPNKIENKSGKIIKEIWNYNKLQKQYIFEMETPGEYKLTAIIDL